MSPNEGRDLDASVDWVLPGEEVTADQIIEVNKTKGEILQPIPDANSGESVKYRKNQIVVKGMPAPKTGK